MKKADASLSTGICALDNILEKIIPGDNVVWQVDSINEYIPFIEAFASHTLKSRKKLIYFRFAGHNELLTRLNGVIKHNLDPLVGFETFTSDIRSVIEKHGKRAHYIFDCLSDLPVYWYSDLMLGNFFVLICPYVWRQKSLAYFALIRYRHSLPVAARIRNTTQILIDAYHYGGELYIHPMKVDKRHSPTMYLPHICKDDSFRPVTDSATVSEVVSSVMGSEMGSASRVFDKWDRTFMEVQEIIDEIERGERPADDAQSIFEKLLHMIISRDKRVLRLATNYLGISDIFEIKKRLIGTGLIGGKSVGMLLARAILQKSNTQWIKLLEVHDSFYIGSDVFYTYIVLNKCWDIRQKQRDPDSFLDGIDEARQRMLTGEFPEFIQEQFVDMLDYFGQSPIIVRSSSLLEDNFGNAFSGKYESVFCVNQGTRTERLKAFLSAVRHVYASTMSKEALLYRARRGLLNHDEQMALLVQRVSGSVYGNIFFPQIAGVGLSFNPYSWSEKIDPEAGVLRLVCGLGTRAVERHDDDYTRVVALNVPKLSPEKNFDSMSKYSQNYVDALDLHKNVFVSLTFDTIIETSNDFPFEIVGSQVKEDKSMHLQSEHSYKLPHVITFERLLSETSFVLTMRDLMSTLQQAYECPVDIEFTTNFRKD
ncbi:MAG TPA: PEP/pyruvate-binding domain-containing protein, partial [Anaerolineae bacterium]|nr:PEP/pyruvate-binding domain-containing protein [Anaerolineae bacterium]